MNHSRQKKKEKRYFWKFILIFLLAVLFVTVYTLILQKNYKENTLEAAVERDIECSDAIHALVSNRFNKSDYEDINTKADMDTPQYQELQKSLNELRTLNSTRYLYTAKRNVDGRLIYLVDGLDLDADDFAYPGTYIEDEMIPYINSALSGQKIYSQDIVDTTWGHIFTACYPVRDNETNEIIGALCIEMDMESSYFFLEQINGIVLKTAIIAGIVLILVIIWSYLYVRRQKEKDMERQKQLKESAEAAEAANKAKSTFLFNMSHDIRTPMNAIIGYAKLADHHLDEPDKLNGYMKNIRSSGEKMLSIIDNILELARIEDGETMLEEGISIVKEGFESCVAMFYTALEEKQQHLSVDTEILYPYVYMDTTHVTEIFLNIMSNAIKYTGNGGNIYCSLKQNPVDESGVSVMELVVADTGIGMSEEYQKRIFDTFSRERSSTVSGIEGSGLGMGIVKKLLDLMHGTIEIKSKLGEGSTFIVKIPCRVAKKEDAEAKRADQHLNPEKLVGKKVLLAEDNDLNAEIAMELLGEEGLTIERAENGVVCVEMLEKAPPDYYSLILMDIQMPAMNGYESTETIRSLQDTSKATIPIIAMTANAFAEDVQLAKNTGMNGHIAKPLDMNKLNDVLKNWL